MLVAGMHNIGSLVSWLAANTYSRAVTISVAIATNAYGRAATIIVVTAILALLFFNDV